MIEHNLIQINRFCNDFHNGENVIFCKIDFLLEEFNTIKNLNRDVILIAGNSDLSFDDRIMECCPQNVKHIFTTNTTCSDERITPIPIGVEMEFPANRIGHGEVNEKIFEKKPFLLSNNFFEVEKKQNKLYANFNIHTNYEFRNEIKNFVEDVPHIFFEFGITYEDFVKKVKSNIATISPRGNGIECLRTYEVLYLNEIPIVIGNFKEYKVIYEKIYKNLPIVFIEDLNELKNLKLIEEKIKKNKNKSKEMIDYFFWKDLIEKKIKKLL